MKSKDLDYAIIILMILSSLYVTFTGLVMDLLDLPMLVFHNYAGYISVVLAGIHLIRNWRRVKIFLRGRSGTLLEQR
ncbi:hypothetical protein ACFLXQ_03590 [Chloroflexota bacterium]